MLALMKRLCGDMAFRLRDGGRQAGGGVLRLSGYGHAADLYTRPEGRTKPLGTAPRGAVCTRQLIHEPFCVINADDYYGADAYRTIYKALQTLPGAARPPWWATC